MNPRLPEVLVIDDNPGDIGLVTVAFEDCQLPATLLTANDGQGALDLLRARATAGQPLPDLILLDLNMPGMSGQEVLAAIKQDAALSVLTVVVMTTSNSPHDRATCLRLGARLYLVKPSRLDAFYAMIGDLRPLLAQRPAAPRPSAGPAGQ